MIRIAIMCCMFLISMNVNAQQTLSLFEAIQKSLENNYDMRMQKMDEQISSLNNNWGTAGRYPVVSFGANANNRFDFNENDDYNQYQLNTGVNLNWVLFDGFRANITKQKLEEIENLSQGYTAVLVENTLQAVILSYYQVLLEEEKLKVFMENEYLSKDRVDYQKHRRELGTSVSYEVLQAENDYLADRANVLLQEANVKAAMRSLTQLMGESLESYTLSDSLATEITDYDLNALENLLMSNNKNLLNQYVNYTLLQKEKALSKANFFPRLSVNAGGQVYDITTDYSTQNDLNPSGANVFANFSLNYTLFNGGVRQRAVQIAQIEEDIALIQTEELETVLKNQLHNTFDFYQARKSLLILAEERMKVAEVNLEISEDKFKSGVINSFNYRDVQLSYQQAAMARLDAVYQLIQTRAELLKVCGQIVSEY